MFNISYKTDIFTSRGLIVAAEKNSAIVSASNWLSLSSIAYVFRPDPPPGGKDWTEQSFVVLLNYPKYST